MKSKPTKNYGPSHIRGGGGKEVGGRERRREGGREGDGGREKRREKEKEGGKERKREGGKMPQLLRVLAALPEDTNSWHPHGISQPSVNRVPEALALIPSLFWPQELDTPLYTNIHASKIPIHINSQQQEEPCRFLIGQVLISHYSRGPVPFILGSFSVY